MAKKKFLAKRLKENTYKIYMSYMMYKDSEFIFKNVRTVWMRCGKKCLVQFREVLNLSK